MAIDEVTQEAPTKTAGNPGNTGKFVAVIAVLVLLAIGQVFTLTRVNSTRESLEAQQTAFQKNMANQFDQQLSTRMTAVESANAQQIDALRKEMDDASKRSGTAGRELRKARAMVDKIQTEQRQRTEALQQE